MQSGLTPGQRGLTHLGLTHLTSNQAPPPSQDIGGWDRKYKSRALNLQFSWGQAREGARCPSQGTKVPAEPSTSCGRRRSPESAWEKASHCPPRWRPREEAESDPLNMERTNQSPAAVEQPHQSPVAQGSETLTRLCCWETRQLAHASRANLVAGPPIASRALGWDPVKQGRPRSPYSQPFTWCWMSPWLFICLALGQET